MTVFAERVKQVVKVKNASRKHLFSIMTRHSQPPDPGVKGILNTVLLSKLAALTPG